VKPESRIHHEWRDTVERLGLGVAGGLLVLFLSVPVLGLVVTISLSDFVSGLSQPLVWPALRLSLLTASASLLLTLLLGAPLAWTLARSETRFSRAVEILVQLPIVIPPAVAGVALLFAFGRRGLLAGFLYARGTSVAFTTSAVIMAELFVSAPFFVQAALSAFRRIDARLLLVARSFGASPLRVFVRVALPLAWPGLFAGAAMTWARALGEFGATLMFAGNLPGSTQTLPLAIYGALEADVRSAQALSALLVAVAFAALMAVRALLRRFEEQGGTQR
jgi:molybdate transport system permease protein